MIRHGRARTPPPVSPLTVAMIPSCFRAVAVAAVGAAMLTQPGLLAASRAAIALSSITAGAEEEHRLALAAETDLSPKNDFTLRRHTPWQAGLDNGQSFVSP